MKLIVGLGNPGVFYSGSRHNIGFETLRYLAKAKGLVLKKEKGIKALTAKTKIEADDVVLALPLTFMNLSGEAVLQLVNKYNVGLADLLVVCDELDLEFGRIKIRPGGSSAGHRGIRSIIDALGGESFCRARIGIGRPRGKDAAKFVLSRFNRLEKKQLASVINNAAECCLSWASEGIEKTMGIFNRKDNTRQGT